jgi:hypothetical protein
MSGAPFFPPVQTTWLDRIGTWAWSVLSAMTGAFVVALLIKSGLMDLAVTTSLSWLAVIAVTAVAIIVIGRAPPDAAAP